jgi:hypothetical protein
MNVMKSSELPRQSIIGLQEEAHLIKAHAITKVTCATPRPLYINFDYYTEGDPEYKKELSALLAGNISELKQDLQRAIADGAPDIFFKATHKAKVVLSMLDDQEFIGITRALENELGNPSKVIHPLHALVVSFNYLCEAISESLWTAAR